MALKWIESHMYQGKSPIIVFMAIRKPTKEIQECSNVYNPDFVIPTCRRSLVAQQELSMLGPKTLCSAHALELITFKFLAAEQLRLMGFDNRLIINCFSNVVLTC